MCVDARSSHHYTIIMPACVRLIMRLSNAQTLKYLIARDREINLIIKHLFSDRSCNPSSYQRNELRTRHIHITHTS